MHTLGQVILSPILSSHGASGDPCRESSPRWVSSGIPSWIIATGKAQRLFQVDLRWVAITAGLRLAPGAHRLAVYGLDPGVTLDRIELAFTGAARAYGPVPETRIGR